MHSQMSRKCSPGTPRLKVNNSWDDEWYYPGTPQTIEVHEQIYDDPPVILDHNGDPFPPSYTKPAMGFALTPTRKRRRK